MARSRAKTISFDDTVLTTWFERDRAHVELSVREADGSPGATLFELWDEDVGQAIEDGFLDPRRYHRSAYDYAVHLGLINAARTRR